MGRLAIYAGVSAALAGGVVLSAFNQRANFYSACVYLAQSNLCLMILINLILFVYGGLMYGLQRLCYGKLRPIEIEQLYEKSWFAITETCLAMTIFREEVGAWFLVMFVALLTGKVWGWIGDGRVEVLEQQPPANPRLFHIRLSISLTMSVLYDLWLMKYIISTVIQQARPNMMVMFLFEFAVLTTSSSATACRYGISLMEARVAKQQMQERLSERRREVREEREELIRQREAATSAEPGSDAAASPIAPLPSEDDIDEMDIDVPGWEAKGQWVLSLDLFTDFMKLAIYLTFFIILLMFYGLPIHIMRDLFMTARSFLKRLTAFHRYRNATKDMNIRYEDATVEDIRREDTCIICREDMRPWSVTNPQAPPVLPGALPPARPAASTNEKTRPKKLPCGHILHLGCLKSWLERQQVCPTCRRPVDSPPVQAPGTAANNGNPAAPAPQPNVPGQQNGPQPAPPRAPGRGMRMLNIGPLRVGFGQANLRDFQQMGAPQAGQDNDPGPRVYGLELGFPRRAQPQPAVPNSSTTTTTIPATAIPEHLQQIEQQIAAQIRNLQATQQELQIVQLLQTELARLRLSRNGAAEPLFPAVPTPHTAHQSSRHAAPLAQMQRHRAPANPVAIPAESADLPPGVTIPEGWSLLPLQRLDSVANVTVSQPGSVARPAPNSATAPTATTQQGSVAGSAVNSAPVTLPTNTSRVVNPHVDNLSTPPTVAQEEVHLASAGSSSTSALQIQSSTPADQTSASEHTTLPKISTTSSVLPTTDVQNEPSTLPNWGSSQLFSNPSQSSTETEASGPSTSTPYSQGLASGSKVVPSTASTNESGEGSEGSEGSETKEKGKAKAVTMEETEDEAEGT